MSVFDKLVEERYEIPFSTRAAYFNAIMQPFGVPPEPVFTKEAQAGMLKIALVLNKAKDEAEAIQAMQREALKDPNVQQAMDYQQALAEREDAMAQLEQMNQQVIEAETRAQEAEQRAMQAEQGAEETGMQAQELQAQLEQEQQGRQEATAMAVQARDQSLQEQISLQEQKQTIAQQAEAFQQQANMLSQQLRQTAAMPTAPAAPPPGGAPGAEEMPPPATADAAQEQQEAANAEQEAAVQGEQAQQATAEDQAKQEQMAAQGGGPSPEEEAAAQEEQAAAQEQAMAQEQQMAEQQAMAEQAMQSAAMPKQGMALFFQKAAMLKRAQGEDVVPPAPPVASAPAQESPLEDEDDEEEYDEVGELLDEIVDIRERLIQLGLTPEEISEYIDLVDQGDEEAADEGLQEAMQSEGPVKAAAARISLTRLFHLNKTASAAMSPQTRGAIIGAAIGALGGVASGLVPGALAGKSDSPGAPTGGALRGGASGAMAGAVSGATGGALLGHALGSGEVGKQMGKAIGGGALVLGAPIAGALSGLRSARSQDYRVKQAAMEKAAANFGLGPKSLNLAKPGTRVQARMTNARNVGKPTGKPGNIGQLTESAFMPKTGSEKCSEMGKCSGCGKMAKLSEMGKCGMCGAKHAAMSKSAAGVMVSPKGSRRLTEQEEAALLMNAERLPKEIIADVNRGLAGTMQDMMPKTAGEVTNRLLRLAKRKAVGAGVGAVAGGGVGAAEVAGHEIKHKGKGKDVPSDKELKVEGKLHAAKLKAQSDPSYANKINVARLRLKRDIEQTSRENPKGHIARRAAEGAIVGAIAEGHARGLGRKGLEALKGAGR